jgi:hypothetical protein
MDDIESKRRRELLVGAGAILAGGGIDPTTYFSIPPHLPADIIADAKRRLS